MPKYDITEVVVNVSLTPKLEGYVKSKVRSGNYNNASEVIREALRLLQQEDEAKEQAKMTRLRKAIQAGIDSPDVEDFDIKDVVKRLKRRR
jgi:antitoxin ParD1/3/4